jgi:hypothetical protein
VKCGGPFFLLADFLFAARVPEQKLGNASMKWQATVSALAFTIVGPAAGLAELIVDPPRPITHRVTVQMIETALSDGTSPATLLGDAAQPTSIETDIDSIWAQAGIDIDFLADVTRYNDTFAYHGNGGMRPTTDLGAIVSNARAAGVTNPDSSVINMFFVNIVPGFSFTSENTANGLSSIGANGVTQFVGDALLTFDAGIEVIARVVAHEIGHNLGLKHPPSGQPNLMSPSGTTSQLSTDQIAAIFQTTFRNDAVAFIPGGGTRFPQMLPSPVPLAGDYNDNGTVDAADFVVWRKTIGSFTDLAADGNGDSIVDGEDYNIWRSNFGSAAATDTTISLGPSSMPEPGSCQMVLIGLAVMSAAGRRRK